MSPKPTKMGNEDQMIRGTNIAHTQIAPVRIRTLQSQRSLDSQRARDIERLRGGREDYGDGISRKFAVREDEGGYEHD